MCITYAVLYICNTGSKCAEPDIHVYCGWAGIICYYIWNPCSMFSTDCRLVCRETCKDNRICIIRCRNRRSSLGISGRTVVQDYRLQELLPYYVSAGTGTWIVCGILPDQNTGRSGTEAIGMGNRCRFSREHGGCAGCVL